MNAVAVALAVLAAACFAAAAAAQHRVARGATTLRVLVRRPLWLLGAGAAGAGTLLHAVALGLAPVTLVQPIGVLAVPLGVLAERWAASRDGRAAPPAVGAPRGPGSGVLAGIAVSVTGVAVFVVAAAGGASGGPVDPVAMPVVGGTLAAAALVLALLSGRWHGAARCLARAVPAAIAFGLVSALLRAGLAYLDQSGSGALPDPADPAVLVAIGVALVVALVAGGAAVQLAYRSGPPSLVLACLTVLDPIVAVGFGVTALGERVGTSPVDVAVAVAGALLAVAGVVLLARHHPDVRHRPDVGLPQGGTTPAPLPAGARSGALPTEVRPRETAPSDVAPAAPTKRRIP
ncbi:hypothetical protein [Pseudonocardia sp. KRD291]|uniref:hypothetical protein n=1 Tax=Pseudonocardia sp. KRD291 TaxID=2792007 RepID=UPI001C49F066|nr:hypothetical protein [Pseudonocardia sp. KRD291]MBW0102595.1 hypothetical protein [Pseudonocardia sp. KRD291]